MIERDIYLERGSALLVPVLGFLVLSAGLTALLLRSTARAMNTWRRSVAFLSESEENTKRLNDQLTQLVGGVITPQSITELGSGTPLVYLNDSSTSGLLVANKASTSPNWAELKKAKHLDCPRWTTAYPKGPTPRPTFQTCELNTVHISENLFVQGNLRIKGDVILERGSNELATIRVAIVGSLWVDGEIKAADAGSHAPVELIVADDIEFSSFIPSFPILTWSHGEIRIRNRGPGFESCDELPIRLESRTGIRIEDHTTLNYRGCKWSRSEKFWPKFQLLGSTSS